MWDLLLISIASLTICISILLIFLIEYLRLLNNKETLLSIAEREAYSKSIYVLMIIFGALLILIAGIMSGVVAWKNINRLKIPKWSIEFFLLYSCILFPVIGSIVATLSVFIKVGGKNIIDAFKNIFRKYYFKTININLNEIGKKTFLLSDDDFIVNYLVLQEWNYIKEWVFKNELKWNLGKNFILSNKEALLLIVDDEWKKQQSELRPNSEIIPASIASTIASILSRRKVYSALIRNRPISIAKASCAIYAQEMLVRGKLHVI